MPFYWGTVWSTAGKLPASVCLGLAGVDSDFIHFERDEFFL